MHEKLPSIKTHLICLLAGGGLLLSFGFMLYTADLNLSLCPPQDIHSQGEVIACLEKGLVREAEEQAGTHPIKEECKKAIMRVAELSSDDFHLDRYLYFSCRDDRERFCENVS